MRAQSSDTNPEIERVQLELLRKATDAQRFGLVRSLSQSGIEWSRQSIREAHPEASEEEIRLLWVALYYGQELADAVRADLARRRQEAE
ncbi:MAG: hypothetical protein M3Y81_18780 [Chloroflexota bacterium]|nr:hypothetical protein [Chloroflexota bacterium]